MCKAEKEEDADAETHLTRGNHDFAFSPGASLNNFFTHGKPPFGTSHPPPSSSTHYRNCAVYSDFSVQCREKIGIERAM